MAADGVDCTAGCRQVRGHPKGVPRSPRPTAAGRAIIAGVAVECRWAGRAHRPSEGFIVDVATAIRDGQSVAEVRRWHRVHHSSWIRWMMIGDGRLTHWNDGCLVDVATGLACWKLAVAVAQARLERAEVKVRELEKVRPL